MRITRITLFIKKTRFIFIVSAIRAACAFVAGMRLWRFDCGRGNASAATVHELWHTFVVGVCGIRVRYGAGRLWRQSREPRGRRALARCYRTSAHVARHRSRARRRPAFETGRCAALRFERKRCHAARIGSLVAAGHALGRLGRFFEQTGFVRRGFAANDRRSRFPLFACVRAFPFGLTRRRVPLAARPSRSTSALTIQNDLDKPP